jgi:hypothetical protein
MAMKKIPVDVRTKLSSHNHAKQEVHLQIDIVIPMEIAETMVPMFKHGFEVLMKFILERIGGKDSIVEHAFSFEGAEAEAMGDLSVDEFFSKKRDTDIN